MCGVTHAPTLLAFRNCHLINAGLPRREDRGSIMKDQLIHPFDATQLLCILGMSYNCRCMISEVKPPYHRCQVRQSPGHSRGSRRSRARSLWSNGSCNRPEPGKLWPHTAQRSAQSGRCSSRRNGPATPTQNSTAICQQQNVCRSADLPKFLIVHDHTAPQNVGSASYN